MSNRALWLSHQEWVEIISQQGKPTHEKYKDPEYKVRCSDGTTAWISRQDLLLQEEEKMIAELALILNRDRNPAKNERYFSIMNHFIKCRVPYVKRLEHQLAKKPFQQTMNLNEVS